MKKILAFVLTFGFVIALTSTVGCSKKETDKPSEKDKAAEKEKKST